MNPADMNPVEVLLLCAAAGAVLSRKGTGIHVEAPPGSVPPELLAALKANKAQLIKAMGGVDG